METSCKDSFAAGGGPLSQQIKINCIEIYHSNLGARQQQQQQLDTVAKLGKKPKLGVSLRISAAV